MNRPNWDTYFMAMAKLVSTRSHDPDTKHGAVLVDHQHRVLSTGYNGYPHGGGEADYPDARPGKYLFIVHAEINALLHAPTGQHGKTTLYMTGFPCPACFHAIIQSGVERVVMGDVESAIVGDDENRIIDFGAGGRQEVQWVGKHVGIEAVPFEPFPRERGKVSIRLAREIADRLLSKLRRGWKPDTVMCQFVLSSIGAISDRQQVLTILSALGRHARQVVIAVRSVDEARYQEVLGRTQNRKSGYLGIPDVTEAGLVVSGAGTAKQKFQKWYAEDEFRTMLRPYFRDIRRASLDVRDSALVMVCRRPVVARKAQLEAALRFEFELKIDGKPLGRSDRAIAAFARYLDRRHRAA